MPATNSASSPAQIQQEWEGRLSALISELDTWAQELGWSTRKIDKQLKDSLIGTHRVPALLMQEGTVRVFAEPIARSAPGADGVVDLYLMPAYDDIASLYFVNGDWQLHYMFPESQTVATIRDSEPKPLRKETLWEVLKAMKDNAG